VSQYEATHYILQSNFVVCHFNWALGQKTGAERSASRQVVTPEAATQPTRAVAADTPALEILAAFHEFLIGRTCTAQFNRRNSICAFVSALPVPFTLLVLTHVLVTIYKCGSAKLVTLPRNIISVTRSKPICPKAVPTKKRILSLSPIWL